MTQVDPTLRPEGDPSEAALAAILEVVRRRTGTDFAGYRAATVRRRVMNRVLSAGAQTLEGYLPRLLVDPGEVGELVERLTIKVSRFYRNPLLVPAVAGALAQRARAAGDRPLRVWSAGCGRGEEAYTLAILLAELGQPCLAGQVVGSDVDPAALRAAAAARYPSEAVVDLPPRLRAGHLQACGSGDALVVREGIRARVRLVAHDLTTEAEPPDGGGFDLVACRNALIYFRPAVQARVERLLLRALAPGGLLWLGEAEWPSRA
ncbi:MAG TPA: CheR family methyltransferase, partial [Anaeromyxobacteraceae bacterium]|nr:CheR family methyltransferase [Anaeromyxobacteraceae bacterium]